MPKSLFLGPRCSQLLRTDEPRAGFCRGLGDFVALDVFPDNRFNWEPTDTGQELEVYVCDASRTNANGPRDEGRVVAALLDARDRTDDCRAGAATPVMPTAVPPFRLRTIWRDAMWGTMGSSQMMHSSFGDELCPALTAAQRPPTSDIFDYSCIDVTVCRMPSEVLQALRSTEPIQKQTRSRVESPT